ncbi:MAG: urease accessory protein UreD [Tepidimonas ignava]|uniref:Urease accessory protein UreD n=1 Tax=Tepidimonas ignava TaxID=114249 RepID=A0A4R3LAN8_9BURK|nr:urease accessory protein UreD [Tepidimonas ignava]MCX7814209.1 urease accessory protein UreD [Tepidimonas ignava]TCS94576.1 urease accessory protein [Tepidimonas ignava]TSE18784.1 Urease accessory protein UreD [Tepidimonas ignava]
MGWRGTLQLRYDQLEHGTTLAFEHDGPLRVLRTLYPEGTSVCHTVLIHPPGGIVGGDTLEVAITVGRGAHALLTTPGATRFYRCDGQAAAQTVRARLAPGARLEWLPQETIAYPGCVASNCWHADLAADAEVLAWEVCALGLPQAKQPFSSGVLHQSMAVDDIWLDEGRLHAGDDWLLNGGPGLAGHRALATLVLASGSPWTVERREHLLATVRALLPTALEPVAAGATCPHERVLVVRGLAPMVEPLMALWQRLWAALRTAAWGLPAPALRLWRV